MTTTDIGKRIGIRPRALRYNAHISQPDLAERVGPRGIETEPVSRHERGTSVPTLPMLSDLAAALGTDLDTFLAGVNNVEPVDRADLKKIVALLESLSDEHLRAIQGMIAAQLDGAAAAAGTTPRTTRKT
jgi:transcriptional regulator with XRE-family HTH domain